MTAPFLGLHVPSFTYPGAEGAGLFPRLAEISATAERSGFTALSVMDHRGGESRLRVRVPPDR